MDHGLTYMYMVGVSFIISAFASAMLAFVLEKYDLF